MAKITMLAEDQGKFGVGPCALMDLVDPKSVHGLAQLGGTEGLLTALHVIDAKQGLRTTQNADVSAPSTTPKDMIVSMPPNGRDEDLGARRAVFGRNAMPHVPPTPFIRFVWDALKDKTLIMLMVAAAISLAIGIYEDLKASPHGTQGVTTAALLDVMMHTSTTMEEHPYSWLEGLSIMLAVLIVVFVSSINDWQKERQFRALNAKNEDRDVKAVRNGAECEVKIDELVVGDVLVLEPGDILPADAVVLQAFNLKCDESGTTGESEAIQKTVMTEDHVTQLVRFSDVHEPLPPALQKLDPFLLSGTKVIEGVGRAVVIAVGIRSFHGKLMASLQIEKEDTPLQQKLDDLAERIAKLGIGMALLMLLTLTLKFIISEALSPDGMPPTVDILHGFISILIQAITILVVAVPEGLPMAVTIALAFATSQMIKDNNLVRVLAACETMGNATTICSDKTGTLTTNVMTVVAASLFATPSASIEDSHDRKSGGYRAESLADMDKVMGAFSVKERHMLSHSIALNSTAFEEVVVTTSPDSGNAAVPLASGGIKSVGSKTEIAMLHFLQKYAPGPTADYQELRATAKFVHVFPFSSLKKSMSCVIETTTSMTDLSVRDSISTVRRQYTKGASEIVLQACDKYVVDGDCSLRIMDANARTYFDDIIQRFANEGLRTIAIAYKDIDVNVDIDEASLLSSLNLIGIFGIEDPVRNGVPEAVTTCQGAGIVVRMVTGDNSATAASIAKKCNILTRGGLIMEGPKFRMLSDEQLTATIPRLQVLARSSPLDKQILVNKLKSMGEIVAVTGDGTNDGPALKAADVGFSMGITGTQVAKEASSIILMDDNFTSIVKAVAWGRCVNDSVRKFLMFQLSVNVTAVIVAFISACANSDNQSVLNAVQLLWVNLLMDTMAALALATEKPSPDLLKDRQPDPKTRGLVTYHMWRMILGQAFFQIVTSLILLFWGPVFFNLDPSDARATRTLRTFIFNVFVLLQIVNEFNCRILVDSNNNNNGKSVSLNPFRNLFSNWIFIAVIIISLTCQIMIVTFGGSVFSTVPLAPFYWLCSILISLLAIPIAILIRSIPDWRTKKPPQRVIMTRERLQWQAAISDVRHGLQVFSALRRPIPKTSLSTHQL